MTKNLTAEPVVINPTAEQLAIFDAVKNTTESIMIEAYAGTGKTSTLEELAKLLKGPVLALAFNADTAATLRKRLPTHFHVKTMNSLGHTALQQALRRFPDLDPQKLSKLLRQYCSGMSKDDYASVREAVRKAMQAGIVPEAYTQTKGLVPDTPEGWAEAVGEPLEEHILEMSRQVLRADIQMVLQKDSIISFDDQIYMPLMFSGLWPKYPTVLVDEVQDFSPMNVLQLSKVARGRIIAVGDQRQSIYVFRGASPQSISTVRALRENWITLPLTVTFRCPKVVVDRAARHAPGFQAAPSAPDGLIGDFRGRPWRWSNIEDMTRPGNPVAVLCRNNAPLIALALKLLRQHQSITIMGNDIAKGLKKLANSIIKGIKPQAEAIEIVKNWKATELAKLEASKEDEETSAVADRADCLIALLESLPDSSGLSALLDKLFAKDTAPIILATGHKAKGLEWDTVVHLDPWRVPGKRALKEGGHALEQEYNLRYVLETRTKHTLILAELKDFI